MTNLRSLSDRFRAVMKLAAVCAFATAIATAAAGQTNTFPDNGNAGIGTTAPTAPLEVKAATSSHSSVVLNTTSTGYAGSLFFQEAGTTKASIQHNPGVLPGALLFNTNGGSSPANTRMVISAAGNIGIGTTSPQTRFDIKQSSDSFVGGLHLRRSSTNDTWALVTGTDNSLYMGYANNASGADAANDFTVYPLVLTSAGNVGVGTATPTYKLHVSGYGGAAGDSVLVTDSNTLTTAIDIANTSTGAKKWRLQSVGSSVSGRVGNFELVEFASNLKAFVVQPGGKVGIGTATPSYKLDVDGAIRSITGGYVFPDGTVQTTAASGGGVGSVTSVFGRTGAVVAAANDYTWAQINKTTSSLADLTTRSAGDLSSGTLPDARFPAALPAVSGANLTSLNASNLTSGTVGATRLGSGTPNSTTFLRGDSTWAAITSSQWANGSGNINYTTGNVGIGTALPTAKLHVSGSGNMQAIVESTTAAAELDLVSNAAGSGKWALGTGWSSAGSIRNLWFYDNVAAAIRLTIDSSGNVGIGNSSPTEKLHVTGNGKFTGNLTVDGSINAKYQDLAEWVPSSEQLAAGTVVVLDTTKSNQVVSSGTAYDTRVAGVISAQPGITLGEGGEGKVLVASTGRVRVKVDASRGAIQIGDLLVTSDVSGVAMKSEAVNLGGVRIHRPGTIIGKALEPLAKGSGEILVLLSLQ